MSAEFEVTREIVEEVRSEIKSKHGGRFLRGELEWITFEVIVDRLRLPWRDEQGFKMPDDNDPRVKELKRKLNQFQFADRSSGHLKKLKIPYPGMEESEFPEIIYAESLPDPDTLAAVADSRIDEATYMFAVLVDRDGKKDVIFIGGPSHDKIQEALQRENQSLQAADWNHAQIALTQGGKISMIMLRNYWGRDDKTRASNVKTLLGKINPNLFVQNAMLLEGIGIVLAGGDTLYRYDPVGNELQDRSDQSLGKVTSLL